jgi:RHS repeat-associated protein
VYDAWNRLVQVKHGSTMLESDAYDAINRNIIQNTGTAVDLFFSQDWQELEERVSGTPTMQYVWSPVYVDDMVERDRSTGGGVLNERLYVQHDANWNVTAILNASGTVQERYIEDPFGSVTVLTPTWSTQSGSTLGWVYLHQGGRYDSTSGLYSFRNRDYSAAQGRWEQVDPLGLAARDPNLYRDQKDNPVNRVDPQGLLGLFFDGAGQTLSTPADDSNIGLLFRNDKDPLRIYYRTYYYPNNIRANIRDAIKQVVKVRAARCAEPIDIFGWSRGAVAAMTVASELARRGISVRFLGLIDPVRTGGVQMLELTYNVIAGNVKSAWVGTRENNNRDWMDRWIFTREFSFILDGPTNLTYVTFPLSHNDIGFDPGVYAQLKAAAIKAGVPF